MVACKEYVSAPAIRTSFLAYPGWDLAFFRLELSTLSIQPIARHLKPGRKRKQKRRSAWRTWAKMGFCDTAKGIGGTLVDYICFHICFLRAKSNLQICSSRCNLRITAYCVSAAHPINIVTAGNGDNITASLSEHAGERGQRGESKGAEKGIRLDNK